MGMSCPHEMGGFEERICCAEDACVSAVVQPDASK